MIKKIFPKTYLKGEACEFTIPDIHEQLIDWLELTREIDLIRDTAIGMFIAPGLAMDQDFIDTPNDGVQPGLRFTIRGNPNFNLSIWRIEDAVDQNHNPKFWNDFYDTFDQAWLYVEKRFLTTRNIKVLLEDLSNIQELSGCRFALNNPEKFLAAVKPADIPFSYLRTNQSSLIYSLSEHMPVKIIVDPSNDDFADNTTPLIATYVQDKRAPIINLNTLHKQPKSYQNEKLMLVFGLMDEQITLDIEYNSTDKRRVDRYNRNLENFWRQKIEDLFGEYVANRNPLPEHFKAFANRL